MYISRKLALVEKNIKEMISNNYYATNPRIIFTTNSLITLNGKDLSQF